MRGLRNISGGSCLRSLLLGLRKLVGHEVTRSTAKKTFPIDGEIERGALSREITKLVPKQMSFQAKSGLNHLINVPVPGENIQSGQPITVQNFAAGAVAPTF